MANPTAQNIITQVRSIIRADGGSDIPVVNNDFLYEAIMDGQGKWEDAFQQSGEEGIETALETGYVLVNDTLLSGDITTATTSFTVDDDNNYDTTDGALLIWDNGMPNKISYDTYTSGTKTFAGVSGISFNHDAEDVVQKLYKLPTNFGSFRESPLYGDGAQLNRNPLKYIGGGIATAGFFSDYTDGTNRFLVLPRQSTGKCSVLFNRAYEVIDDVNDIVSVPTKYKFFLIWHCIAYCYIGRADDANRMLYAQGESEKVLSRALRGRNTEKKIRTRSFGRISGDHTVINGQRYPLSA